MVMCHRPEPLSANRPFRSYPMESFAYILILTLAIATLFFAIAFRDPPKIGK